MSSSLSEKGFVVAVFRPVPVAQAPRLVLVFVAREKGSQMRRSPAGERRAMKCVQQIGKLHHGETSILREPAEAGQIKLVSELALSVF